MEKLELEDAYNKRIFEEAFKIFTTTTKTSDGYMVQCNKGFWGVTARSKQKAEHEAKHYFAQHYRYGEYFE